MQNQFDEYYRSLRRRGGLFWALVAAVILHIGLMGLYYYINLDKKPPEAVSFKVAIVPGEVRDPTKEAAAAAPEVKPTPPEPEPPKPPEPEPPKEEPKPEPPKPPEPKPEPPKPEPKKEEPKKETPKKEEPKKEEPKKDPPKKEEPKKDPPKKEEPKKEDPKKEEKKPEPKPTPKPKPAEFTDPEMLEEMPVPAKHNPNNQEGPVKIQDGDMTALGMWPANVERLVRRSWRVPSGVNVDAVPAVLGFWVNRDGSIEGTVEIISDSTSAELTESALYALEMTKLPPLPDSYEKPRAYVEYHFTIGAQ